MKAVLFDLDGTLVSLDSVVKALQLTCRQWKLKVLTKKEIYGSIVGKSLEKGIIDTRSLSSADAKRFRSDYHENYSKVKTKSLPHATGVLRWLKDRKLKIALVTTKSRVTALDAINDAGLIYDVLITEDDVSAVKPSPEPILAALKKLGVSPKEAMMVGDHVFDAQAAKKAGCKAIGITTGVKTRKELTEAGADYVINDLNEIKVILNG